MVEVQDVQQEPQQEIQETVKSKSPSKNFLILVPSILLGVAVIFVGYLFGSGKLVLIEPLLTKESEVSNGKAETVPVKSNNGNQNIEISYGDEDFDTDPDYKEAMENIEETDSKDDQSLILFESIKHGFSFSYPLTVFAEITDGESLPLVYLDTSLIVIPSAYDRQLTPVEIRIASPGEYESYESAVEQARDLFLENTLTEKKLTGSVTGTRLSGTVVIYGVPEGNFERVILDSPKGIIVIDFLKSASFSEELFDQILATFKFI